MAIHMMLERHCIGCADQTDLNCPVFAIAIKEKQFNKLGDVAREARQMKTLDIQSQEAEVRLTCSAQTGDTIQPNHRGSIIFKIATTG